MVEYAIEYAKLGCSVFPCHTVKDGKCTCGKPDCSSPGKHPRTMRGLQDATTDHDQIKKWWEMWPDSNIAWALPGDVIVVDVDIKHDEGKLGDESLNAWTQQNGVEMPHTVLSLTGGGGVQYFYSTQKEVTNRTGLLDSVDVRTKGGYVILPPSQHISGRQYEWEASSQIGTIPFAPIPVSLLDLMTQTKSHALEVPEMIPQGARNDTLFKMACSMRAKGFAESEILAALRQANKDRCSPPLADQELEKLVESAVKYQMGPTAPDATEQVTASDENRRYYSLNLLSSTLKELGITIRLNVISQEVEVTGYPRQWSAENAVNNLPTYLVDHFRKKGVKGTTKNNVCDGLELLADETRYNPVADMLTSGKWDENNRVMELYEIMGITDTFSMQSIFRWLLQCVAMAFNNPKDPYGADGVLTLQGPQGIGKTSVLRKLVPIPKMFKGGATLDPSNKDTIIQATSHWIVELGELERTTRFESSHLKAILTAESDQYRAPYARAAVKRPRRTSFCASVNPGEFLVDDTGNRRFWTVPVTKIDLGRLFGLNEHWVKQLWYQIYEEWKESPESFRLTAHERQHLNAVNSEYTKPMAAELEIRALLTDIPRDQWIVMRPAEIAKRITPTPPAEKVGRALAKLAREGVCESIKRDKIGARYLVPIQHYPTPN